MKILLGIAGKKGSGKTTFAKLVAGELNQLGIKSVTISFADTIKNMLSAGLGWSIDDLEDERFKATPDPFWKITPRHAMQTLGTEWGRNCIADDLWLRCVEKKIIDQVPIRSVVIIPDVRFGNEAAFIRSKGNGSCAGKLFVHIEADDEKRIDAYDDHPSEKGVDRDRLDVIVHNSRNGINELLGQARAVAHIIHLKFNPK